MFVQDVMLLRVPCDAVGLCSGAQRDHATVRNMGPIALALYFAQSYLSVGAVVRKYKS